MMDRQPRGVHGINVLPVTGGSLHLVRNKDAIRRSIAEMERRNGGPVVEWRDIHWEFLALADPAEARAAWGTQGGDCEPEAGESRAHTYHWIGTLDALGAPDTSVTADSPTAAVFSKGGTRTYAAHNFSGSPKTAAFSDGGKLTVPARSTAMGTGTAAPGPARTVA